MRSWRSMAIGIVGLFAVAVASLIVFVAVSPWPGAFLITKVFAGNDAASEAALAKHVPAGIKTTVDLAYGSRPDEKFDISYPSDIEGPLPLILWVHGGAWVGGSKAGVANYLKILANYGYAVVGIDYSRAPGATYPTPTRQTLAALEYLVRHADELGIDRAGIAVGGDSAGAQIAAQAAMVITNPAYANEVSLHSTVPIGSLRAVLLVSGAFDMSDIKLDGEYAWFIKTVLWAYSGVRDFMNDEQFVLGSITPNVSSAFPPTFLTSGDADPLEPQARSLANRLKELNVPTSTLFFEPGPMLNHEYQFNLDTPQGRQALKEAVLFLGEHLQ